LKAASVTVQEACPRASSLWLATLLLVFLIYVGYYVQVSHIGKNKNQWHIEMKKKEVKWLAIPILRKS
jgi:hypothetical protein